MSEELQDEVSQEERRIYRVLLWIILPFGTGVWAFAQLATPPELSVGVFVGLVLVTVAGFFVAFRHTIDMAADRFCKPVRGDGL